MEIKILKKKILNKQLKSMMSAIKWTNTTLNKTLYYYSKKQSAFIRVINPMKPCLKHYLIWTKQLF